MDFQPQSSNDIPIERGAGDDVEIALKWDFFEGMDAVDLDAQAVLFNSTGSVVDAAFYNQLQACGGSVTHSGDNRSGAGEGDDETLRIDFENLPSAIKVIAIVVTAYSGGTFQSVETASCELRDLTPEGARVIGDVSVGCKGPHTALVLAILYLAEATSTWYLRQVGSTANGKHFQDCLDSVRAVVDTVLDPNLTGERVLSMEKTFEMHKNDVALIPEEHQELKLGLGWTTSDEQMDLDASCLFLDQNFRTSDDWVVYFGNQELPGAKSLGDNRTGKGDGDDETIVLDLKKVPPQIHHLALTVNIYSDDRLFAEVSSSYVRLLTMTGHVMARYTLDSSIQSRGLFFGVVSRKGNQWTFKAVGTGVDGKRGKDQICYDDVLTVMQGGQPETTKLGAPEEQPTQVQASAEGNSCCVIL